jgi:hypothetical protein
MDIFARITGIKYKPINVRELKIISFNQFDINDCPASCMVMDKKFNYSISKWISPKRTRSYPYEHVYDTLGFSKRITVIPIIKDEGKNGDRDFLQWDTVSLMSLLDVYVIFAYYEKAELNPRKYNKITNQRFNNEYVKSKIIEINDYHSSALHWNLKEIEETLPPLIDKVKEAYSNIEKELNVELHSFNGIDKFKNQFYKGVENFKSSSREKAKEAQNREKQTIQPKESLSSLTKATITIENYLGGLYYFTTDEIEITGNDLFLIESKHSRKSILPSIGDIKDGLLKLILYCNLEEVLISGKKYNPKPVLKLTSEMINGEISSNCTNEELRAFFDSNNLNIRNKDLIHNLFTEAKENGFSVLLRKAN